MLAAKSKWFTKAQEIFSEIVKIRRHLHKNPEIGFDVEKTAELVASELEKLGIEVRREVGRTGVLGYLRVDGASETIALRADMDALPMQEENSVEYKSTVPGKAHMCGHDAHTAMLIGAAKILAAHRSELKKNVRFIFQPSEELLPGGALGMIEDGALEGVDSVYGLHVWPTLDCGYCGICESAAMAQASCFKIIIEGKGGHAGTPHKTIDPILLGSQAVLAIQSIVSRSLDPLESAVVGVTLFHAGDCEGVTPQRAELGGTIRSYKTEVQDLIVQRLKCILDGITAAHGAKYSFDYNAGYPPTINHPVANEKACKSAVSVFGKEQFEYPAKSVMFSEDFSYYGQKVPACFIQLGCRNEEKGFTNLLHDPRFDIDEDCMQYGIALHVSLAMDY
jgi:amidohydrolase